MSDVEIELEVNGARVRRTVPAHRLLRDFVRDELGLTGTKAACDDGMCGSCALLLGDDVVKSCLVLAADVQGEVVTTIEGLAGADEDLHPVQQAMLDQFGFQCGFCTPGMVTTMVALLDSGRRFDETTAREALVGNICRCTGYTMIVAALLQAQEVRDAGRA